METTIGGDRLGSGNKQTTSFKNFERSSHDLGYIWRSSMSSGTLVPFMSKLALPGDKWEIDLNAECLTLPTLGPLFGSYKLQLDVFEVPIRLYNAKLHMNKFGVGMDMKSIFLPQIELKAYNPRKDGLTPALTDNGQINASSLAKYLGVSGLGYPGQAITDVTRNFNAVPFLGYWEIYGNYYANKQEEIGYYIHTSQASYDDSQRPKSAFLYRSTGTLVGNILANPLQLNENDFLDIYYPTTALEPDPGRIECINGGVNNFASDNFNSFIWFDNEKLLRCVDAKAVATSAFQVVNQPSPAKESPKYYFGIKSFPLENINTMREQILQFAGASEFVIDETSPEPYNALMQPVTSGSLKTYSAFFSQESLGLKTYQSDLFNNWINTEWIDGAGGISELTAVDTSTGDFTIDALNIATKVYDMLNRIAVSGGSYDDWLEAVYTHERVKGVESPVYCGSLIKELAFEEVVSLAETTDPADLTRKQPLGTLAGRGRLTGKHKGGKVIINTNEPSYIIGLVSLTPRIDYSQGNNWDMDLKTYDDFHKPSLDGIGFQDLICEQLHWGTTTVNETTIEKTALGKQPAWINYMTSVNKTYGAFAESDNSMWMTLNRRYEINSNGTLKDATTYIDPTKYNQVFAEVALDSQNFWVQIACNITARRKMSAKIIPNL